MWYFIWILSTFFACTSSIIIALSFERVKSKENNKE